MKILLSAALASAALALPGLALADAMAHDAMAHGAMAHDAMHPATAATMLCRPAAAGEKPIAMTMGTKSPLVCKAIAPQMMQKGKGGPDLSQALTPDQVDAAWRAYIQSVIVIPNTGGG
ncbi:MAG: hypothetical protein JO164_13215 [Candidatus Eremiobacteraeota bacterium]|nr:hypothetical protein [Candidatus Eremiobacteraeota bacterium]